MLAFAEHYLRRIRAATNDNEIIAIIGQLAAELGYRSGYLIEYSHDLKKAELILDTNSGRSGWWDYYRSSGLRPTAKPASEMIGKGTMQYLTDRRFTGPADPMLTFARRVDMVNAAVVPIRFDHDIFGMVALCGERILSSAQENAVQFVCYSLFSQARSFRLTGVRMGANLTPREREVMALSSEGLTSQEVADQLGMSPRTVNQHMDNVADKLGTRNRVHTVAEAIRRDLL